MVTDKWIENEKVHLTSLLIIFSFFSCINSIEQKTTQNTVKKNQLATLLRRVQLDSVFAYDTTKKYVYLTFDDGLQRGTMNCFRIMRELNIKGSFFIIGSHITDAYPQSRVDSIHNGYPEFLLCNHSFTHANYNHYRSYYNHPGSAFKDVMRAEQRLQLRTKIFRTLGNDSWAINGRLRTPHLTRQLCTELDFAGYKVAGWDVEWRFKSRGTVPVESADQMIKEIKYAFKSKKNFTPNHVVLLTHDRMFEEPQYADSLKKIITALRQNSKIVFEAMDRYPGISISK